MNEDVSKILTVPVSNGMDPASMMAMQQNSMFNNPWAYLILLSIFQNGGFGNRFGNGGAAGAVVATDIDAKLNSLANQISQNQSTDSIISAIQGNSFAQSQLAQNLNVDYNAIVQAINGVNMAIAQTAANTGMSIAGVQNAISSGNLNIIQSMKDCCCSIKTEVLQQGFNSQLQTVEQTNLLNSNISNQGYENRLANLNQTNTLNNSITNQGYENRLANLNQTNTLNSSITNQGYENQIRTINQTQDILLGVRAENTLTRASIDAFRSAWEQGRYADLLQKNNALQDKLNVLEIQSAGTAAVAAAVAPLQAQVNSIAAHQLPTYPQAFIPGYPVTLTKADTTNP